MEEGNEQVDLSSLSLEVQRRVMIAVDDSDVSSYAFTWALRNLIRDDDHVIVLTAAPYKGVDYYPTTEIATGTVYGGKGVRMSDVLVAGTEYAIPTLEDPEEEEVGHPGKFSYNNSSKPKRLVNKYLQLLLKSQILSCEGEVVKGDAGSWIADEAQRLAADVIIVGSHGTGLVKRTLIGSTSDYVLHNAPCTVAIVRQSEEALAKHDPLASSGGARKIVIAVDESKEAKLAFIWALKHVCSPEDHVILYHVHQPTLPPITAVGTGAFGMEDVYVRPEAIEKDEVAALKDSQKIVEKFMEFAKSQTDVKCEGRIVTGETQSKVVEGLNALKADIVIVGTHDRSAVLRTFLGSVSDHLAHNSPCPLIVVKNKRTVFNPNQEGEQFLDETANGVSPRSAFAGSPRFANPFSPRVANSGSPRFTNPASPRFANPGSPRFANGSSPRYANPYSPRIANPSSPRCPQTFSSPFSTTPPTHEPSPLSQTRHDHSV